MSKVPKNDSIRQAKLPQHSSATVFTQVPNTNHLLAVDFDAETRNVADVLGGWRILSFRHVSIDGRSAYSSVDLYGDKQHLAGPCSSELVPQILPAIYDYQETDINGRSIFPKVSFAGLIGSLPLLLAMAAFSAPPDELAAALNCVQPGFWRPHNLYNGRSTFSSQHMSVNSSNDHLKLFGSEVW